MMGVIFHYVFKLVHLFLVHMLDCFGDIFISPSMFWTSIFDKFLRMHFIVHGLDVLNICSSMGWTVLKSFAQGFLPRLIFGRVYLAMKGILAFHLCRPENFLVHGVADLNKNLNKSTMGIMDSHNTMYIT